MHITYACSKQVLLPCQPMPFLKSNTRPNASGPLLCIIYHTLYTVITSQVTTATINIATSSRSVLPVGSCQGCACRHNCCRGVGCGHWPSQTTVSSILTPLCVLCAFRRPTWQCWMTCLLTQGPLQHQQQQLQVLGPQEQQQQPRSSTVVLGQKHHQQHHQQEQS